MNLIKATRSVDEQICSISRKDLYDEKWEPIKFFEDSHLCSNYGRILLLDRVLTKGRAKYLSLGKILKPYIDKDGYMNIVIVCNKVKKRMKIHRIVAECFIKSKDNSLDVDHIDFNKLNNHISNLRYLSKYQNTIHSATNGRYKKNSILLQKNRIGKETFKFDKNGVFIAKYKSLGLAAMSVSGQKSMISRAIVGRSKTAYGYKWSYSF